MANKTLEKLKDEFDAVSDLTREAYDAIYSQASGRNFKGQGTSLDQKYKLALKDYKKNPDKINKEILDALKPEWEKRQAAYKKLQEQKNSLKKELKAAEKEAEKTKQEEAKQKLALSGYQKALKDLEAAEVELGTYGGDKKYIDAYQKAQAAYDNATESGAKPKALPPQKITVPTQKEKTKAEGETGTGKEGEEQAAPEISNITEFFDVLADPKNKQQLIEVQRDLIKNFGWKGKADGRWSLSFQTAVQSAAEARDRLPASLRKGTLREFLTNPGDVDLGLGEAAGGAPTRTTTTTVSRRTKGDINKDINDIALKVLGREITAEDKQADWYGELVGSINKMVERGTTTTSISGGTGGRGRTEITPGFAQEDIEALIERRLKKADPESLARNERIDFITWMNQALGGR